MDTEMIKELGEFKVDLDGRFSSVRTRETNLGNFICDVMVAATNADFALLNSGTLRDHPYMMLTTDEKRMLFSTNRGLPCSGFLN